jgi:L-alanine-DL-glutamate epimerase-like enolase superfamily enzyme
MAFSPLLGAAAGPRTTISARSMRLDLVNTWTTVMSSSTYRETLGVSVVSGGITGVGEGAPIVRYNESAAQGIEIVNGLREVFVGADPSQYVKLLDRVFAKVDGGWATKAAIDIALHDWAAKRMGVPLWKMWGLDRNDAPLTTSDPADGAPWKVTVTEALKSFVAGSQAEGGPAAAMDRMAQGMGVPVQYAAPCAVKPM